MTAQILLSRAIELHQAGQFGEAAELYRQVIAADARNFRAHYLLAAASFQQQRLPEALVEIEAALAIDPNAAEAVLLEGLLLKADGRHGEAVSRLERAAALNPRYVEAWQNLGMIYLDLKRHAEAVAAFDKALLLKPGAETSNNRGLGLQALGRNDEALASYRQALTIRPDFAAAYHNIGALLCNMRQRLEEALAAFDKVLTLEPRNEKAWTGRALALSAMQRFDEALASTDQALAINPDHAPALSIRGTILCETNHVADAMTVFARHAELTHVTVEKEPSPHKLHHDREQRAHLSAKGITSLPDTLHIANGARLPGPAINPVNVESATRDWQGSNPQIVVIDDLLTEEALTRLQAFCHDSTMWRRDYRSGYLGAMPESGFAVPLLAQIADELRETFPAIFNDHALRYLWGFKYDSALSGTGIHADFAAVNVNFWITPDAANLDLQRGGLVVWDVSPPLDWDFARYNGDDEAIRAFLARSHAKPVTIPYRCNRAVIFDSDLFHQTDTIAFKPGYDNRRINVTMLYGRRKFSGG